MFEKDELLHTLPFQKAIAHFLSYVSQSIDRAKTIRTKLITTVLIRHKVYTFDTSIILRNVRK